MILMFFIGLLVGLVCGAIIGIFIAALAVAAKKGDEMGGPNGS